MIGIGVGAGAYALTRFAVSPHQNLSIFTFNPFIFLYPAKKIFVLFSVLPVIIEALKATQHVTLLKASQGVPFLHSLLHVLPFPTWWLSPFQLL